MKRLIKKLKLIFILLLFLFGCSNSVSEKVQPYFLLSENTCSFPCWMGITPGETTAPEAEEMLEQLVHRYAQKGIEITYTKDFTTNTYGNKDYFYYVLTRNSKTLPVNILLNISLGICLNPRAGSAITIFSPTL